MRIRKPFWLGAAALAGMVALGGVAGAAWGPSGGSGGSAGGTGAPGGAGGAGGAAGPGAHMGFRHPGGPRGVFGVAQDGVTGGTFTVKSWSKTYTVTVNSSTKYNFGPGLTASASDVAQGEQVMVGGTVSGTDVTAKMVHIAMPGVRGAVTAVSGTDLTVQAPDGRQAIVDISGVTGAPAITSGEQVAAAGKWVSDAADSVVDTLDAQAVAVVPAHLFGVVASSTGAPGATGSATVQTRSGTSVTVDWTSSTTFASGPKGAAPTSIATGQRIMALGQMNGSTFDATRINVMPAPGSGPGGSQGHGGPQGGNGSGSGSGGPQGSGS